MRQTGPAATASRLPTIRTKSIYATDLGPSRPARLCGARRAAGDRRTIRLGQVEVLPHGTLRCVRAGRHVVISVRDGSVAVGRTLRLGPFPPRRLVPSARFREADFSSEVAEFIGTPWHELEYISLWTVAGLRRNGKMERSQER